MPSTEEGTVVGDADEHANHNHAFLNSDHSPPTRPRSHSYLTVKTAEIGNEHGDPLSALHSPSWVREQSSRLVDDLEMLKVERQVSRNAEDASTRTGLNRTKSRRHEEPIDDFDEATNPVHEKTQVYKPVENPSTGFAKFMKNIHASNWLVRYVTYIAPLTLILLIPLLVCALQYKSITVGDVYLMWFMIWLEIVWLTLWAGRILAKCLPVPLGVIASLFTNNSKKWRDMGKQLELPATLFFWWLAIEISFLPTMTNHQKTYPNGTIQPWMNTMNKVLVSFLVAAVLNFVAKILIQLIAISFHLRTYADRIEINKFQIGSLAKLYKYSKEKIAMEDSEFALPGAPTASGARTPGALISEAARTAKQGFNIFGDVAGKVAGDFTGRKVTKSTHPDQVVLALLHTPSGSQVLARRLYRTFAREETETVVADDLREAFDNNDEADAAFTMFDKDMNGDISMEELEAVCVEIGRERKSITASLKDLDSVVSRLDDVFMFIVFIIAVLVLISLISVSAGAVITSAGSTVLALSWLFSATAQEFLQSVIFVFVKHPFDVGDRVSIYGNTGSMMKGDDYFVKEISLLYTEFKKMEGHIVQAPNSYLNTLFILNQRRSGGLAEAVTITIKFGTTLEQIDGLRARLLEFVTAEKREYQSNILTELREIDEVHSMKLNVVFFYKSNWQNEGLRLARRNKFICAMMVTMQELGIEGPRMRYPGQRESFPMYLQNVPHTATGSSYGGHPDNPHGQTRSDNGPQDPPFVAPLLNQDDMPDIPGSVPPTTRVRGASILRSPSTRYNNTNRPRGESLAAMNRRVDFSLGMRDAATTIGDSYGDVYEDRTRMQIPIHVSEASRDRSARQAASSLERVRTGTSTSMSDTAQSTSREMPPAGGVGLARRSTESNTAGGGRWAQRQNSNASATATTHRNRFFGRYTTANNNASLDNMMESGMADIPEGGENSSKARTPVDPIDPRTGTVSSRGWRADSQASGMATVAGNGGAAPQAVTGMGARDSIEMKRL
jgi:small-conductance mechanosensitive channel